MNTTPFKRVTLLMTILFATACGNQSDPQTDSSEVNSVVEDTNEVVDTAVVEASPDRCAAVKASVADAGFSDVVAVHCDEAHAYLTSNVYPDHPKMTGILATNEQTPTPVEGYSAPVVLNSVLGETPQTRDSSVAVAVNGVPIFDYTSGGEMTVDELYSYHALIDTITNNELDPCGGHAGRADDYHYHELPRCMLEQMDNKDDNPIIGWAFDGFPLYGNNNPDGSPIVKGDLDVCNGQADPVFGYRYHTSETPPYIIQCIMGEVAKFDELPRISGSRPSGTPPIGGVENFTFTEQDDGLRTLTYDYEGESYYVNYTLAEEENCFDFEYKSVTNGGQVESGQFCSTVATDSRRPGGPGMGGPGMGGPDMGGPPPPPMVPPPGD